MSKFNLKRGYDIALEGIAETKVRETAKPDSVAIKPTDFNGLIARMDVEEGETVKIGSPLFHDKTHEQLFFTSPISGMVVKINRGMRRVIEEVIIRNDNKEAVEEINVPSIDSSREMILEALLNSGLFPFFVQRPFARIANPSVIPRDIFISLMDTAPLAATPSLVLAGREKEFLSGISVLANLTSGSVHLSLGKEDIKLPDLSNISNVERHFFSGPHPAGNVGIQIHHIAPIAGRSDVVWTCSLKGLLMIGALFSSGKLNTDVLTAVTGTSASERNYVKTKLGAQISSVLNVSNESIASQSGTRYISGNPLTGKQISATGFVGFFDTSVTLLPEVEEPELFGWALPGFKSGSKSRTFMSALLNQKHLVKKHTGLNGGERAFIATGIYRDVLPMDIYPDFLMKSILAEDIPLMEGLGIHEIAEEDVALCEYICPSKIEWQHITRRGLDFIERET